MALPTLISEVDFDGNPTATYHDTLFYDDSCQSYWRMSDASTLVDEKDTSDGTFGGAPSLVSSLLPLDSDQALSYDGIDDYASVPSTSALQQAGSWVLEGLLKFDVGALPGALKPLVTKGSFSVEVTAANKLQFSVQNHVSGVTTKTTVTGTSVLEEDRAYHVECIHDAAAGELRIVVDGRVEAIASHTVGTELWGLPLLFAARHSSASPSFGSVGATFTAAPSDPWVVGAPASIAVDDLLICQAQTTNAVTLTPPAGWQTFYTVTTANRRVYWFYKVAVAGDVGAASYSFDASASASGKAVISRFTGVDPDQPFANPPYAISAAASGLVYTTGARVPQCDDTLLLGFVAAERGVTWTPSGGTERYDTGNGGGGVGAFDISLATNPVGTASGVGIDFTANTALSGTIVTLWVALKGPDAQDFCDVTLDDWAFLSSAPDDDTALDHSEARYSGEGTWVDITDDSKGFDLTRARQYELDRFEAGTLRETLKDPNRDYDPTNTAGAYYPNVKTKRRTRKRAVVGGVTFPIFDGYVERWPPTWLTSTVQEVTLSASDGMAALALAPVSGSVESGLSGAQIHRILDMARWPRELRRIDDGAFIMAPWTFSTGQKALPALQEIADSELGQLFLSADGYVTFHDYAHRWSDTRSLNTQATLSDVDADIAAGAIPYLIGGIEPDFDDDTTINEWSVSTADGDVVTVSDVVGGRQSFGMAESRSTRISSIVDAETQALALLQRTARAGQRFDKITVAPNSSRVPDTDAAWQAILGLEFSDRVRVIRTPGVGSQITQDCFVEGIEIEEDPGNWTVTLSLSPVSPASFYETAVRSAPISYYRLNEVT